MAELQGVCTPICTVFNETGRNIDENAQLKHIDTLLEAGIHIIAICEMTDMSH